METWFIHINQAVRKYNKTRQTFYNYINKWYVKTKKVNNKVFLNVIDIEKLLNDYITWEQVIITPNEDTYQVKNVETQEDRTQNIPNWIISSIENKLFSWLNQLEHTLLQSTKAQHLTSQKAVSNLIEAKNSHIMTTLVDMEYIVSKNSLKQRKILFWMYYLVFVSINVFILRYIS